MATRKAPAKRGRPKKVVAEAAVEENGAKRTRTDKLAGLTDAKKRNIAKLIYRERSRKPATNWPDITEMISDKYDWTLPGSMTGRRLLREFGPEDAEEAIIKQEKGNSTGTKKRATKKVVAKKKRQVVEEEEDELEDEDLEEEDETGAEYEDEYEDEDEDEEEDEEPEPVKAKKVTVKRGRGRKANPS